MDSEEKENDVQDDDDVIIIGNIMPKPMITLSKKTIRRHITVKNSKSLNGSLVRTNKVKFKKRKQSCVSKYDTNTNAKHDEKIMEDRSKCEKENDVRTAPVCLRQKCKDIRCKIERYIKKQNERRLTKIEAHSNFPRDLKRLLSPISPSPMKNETSKSDFEISIDGSSFEDEKESKLDLLIKRSRDRGRNNLITSTQYLCTLPRTDTPISKDVEDEKISTNNKPPYTSTPLYKENITYNINALNYHNNVTEESMKDHHPFFNRCSYYYQYE